MHEKEIQYFMEALKLANEDFFMDATTKFQQLINEFPESDLADDAMYNIGLCYYEMNQFEKAISILQNVIELYPDATITAIENNNEFGKTAAKAYYLMINCYLAEGKLDKAQEIIPTIEKYTNTYVTKEDEKVSFAQLASKAVATFLKLINKEI